MVELVFLSKTVVFDPDFAFSPLPDASGRGWGWGEYYKTHPPPLKVVLPLGWHLAKRWRCPLPHCFLALCFSYCAYGSSIANLRGGGSTRTIRRISVISAASNGTPADIKCHFSISTGAFRRTNQR
jgi:hypothetical protein